MSENFSSRKKIVWNAIKSCTKDALTTFEIDKQIDSPFFYVPIEGLFTQWCLGLIPNSSATPSYMDLCLFRIDDLKLRFTVNFSFYIIGKFGRHAESSFRKSSDVFGGRYGYGTDHFFSHSDFADLFDDLELDEDLKIGCTITISSLQYFYVTPIPKASDDVQRMFEDETCADFELRCNDDQKLKCHKFILAARSPVFYAMLSNDMQEAQEGFAEVPDFDSTVMTEILRFIYCDRVENLDNISKELIFAAEKYDLDYLKNICIQNILQNLTKTNVVEVLLITDKISGCKNLFKKCVAVVARSLQDDHVARLGKIIQRHIVKNHD